jgi:hypothetical protein
MQVCTFYYDLYFANEKKLISGSYKMSVSHIREIFDKAFDMIRENERKTICL